MKLTGGIAGTRSDIAPNQCLALQHIATLSVDSAFIRQWFIDIGTFEFLESFDPRLARCDVRYIDELLSSSRRALFTLHNAELNVLMEACEGSFTKEDAVNGLDIMLKMCNYLG